MFPFVSWILYGYTLLYNTGSSTRFSRMSIIYWKYLPMLCYESTTLLYDYHAMQSVLCEKFSLTKNKLKLAGWKNKHLLYFLSTILLQKIYNISFITIWSWLKFFFVIYDNLYTPAVWLKSDTPPIPMEIFLSWTMKMNNRWKFDNTVMYCWKQMFLIFWREHCIHVSNL